MNTKGRSPEKRMQLFWILSKLPREHWPGKTSTSIPHSSALLCTPASPGCHSCEIVFWQSSNITKIPSVKKSDTERQRGQQRRCGPRVCHMWLWCTCCAKGTASSPHMRVKCARQTGQSTPRGCTLCGRTRCTAPRTLCGTTRRGVHPSPICRRQVACARPCLVSERLQARVKICHFIENPSPMSKDPDQLPRDRTPCNHSNTATQQINFYNFQQWHVSFKDTLLWLFMLHCWILC